MFLRRHIDHRPVAAEARRLVRVQAQLPCKQFLARGRLDRFAQGAGVHRLHQQRPGQRLEAIRRQQVGLAGRDVHAGQQTLRPLGHSDPRQSAPRRIAGHPASIEQHHLPAVLIAKQADDVMAIAALPSLIVHKHQGAGQKLPAESHPPVGVGIGVKLEQGRQTERGQGRPLGMASGQGRFLGRALELPKTQGNQRRRQQQGQSRGAPLQVQTQPAHRGPPRPDAPAPTGESPRLYSALSRFKGAVVLKVLIVLFMLMLVASLFSGFYFLMVDQGAIDKRRTVNSLGVRLGLALGLMGLIVYGVASGQLGHRNPWDSGPQPQATEHTEQEPAQ